MHGAGLLHHFKLVWHKMVAETREKGKIKMEILIIGIGAVAAVLLVYYVAILMKGDRQ